MYESRIHLFLVLSLILGGGGLELERIPAGQFITELSEQDKQTHTRSNRKLEEPLFSKYRFLMCGRRRGNMRSKASQNAVGIWSFLATFRLRDINPS